MEMKKKSVPLASGWGVETGVIEESEEETSVEIVPEVVSLVDDSNVDVVSDEIVIVNVTEVVVAVVGIVAAVVVTGTDVVVAVVASTVSIVSNKTIV